jgi:chromosome segregation ATPase
MDDTRVAVLLEDLRGQFQAFGDALQGTRESLEQRTDHLEQRIDHVAADLGQRIDRVAADLGQRIDGLGWKLDALATEMVDVKQRVAGVERVVNGKA